MSFVFRGSGGDLESGFSGFIPERRAMVCLLLLLHTFSKYINYCVKSDLCWNYYSCISVFRCSVSMELDLLTLILSLFLSPVIYIPQFSFIFINLQL